MHFSRSELLLAVHASATGAQAAHLPSHHVRALDGAGRAQLGGLLAGQGRHQRQRGAGSHHHPRTGHTHDRHSQQVSAREEGGQVRPRFSSRGNQSGACALKESETD